MRLDHAGYGRALSLASLLLLASATLAQTLVDDFDDGFDPSLGWQGDVDAFRQNGGRLQLDDMRDPSPGEARVWVAAPVRDSACWSLDVNLAFDPSSSNFARWWLTADRPLSEESVSGHYVQVGGVSGINDAYELVFTDGTVRTVLAATEPSTAAFAPAAQIDVCFGESRTQPGEGQWMLEATPAGQTPIAAVSPATPEPLSGSFTGLELRYTATRRDAFSFDDLRVAPLFADTDAPSLVSATAVDATTIRLVASEPLDVAAGLTTNYTVTGSEVLQAEASGAMVVLTLRDELPSEGAVAVRIDRLADLAGNVSGPFETTVRYVAPLVLGRYDVLINEIMADPNPAVGLPEVEYLELYNATDGPVSLADLRLQTIRGSFELPDTVLAANAFVALTSEPVADDRFVVASELPTLTNSGALLRLMNTEGEVVDEVEYSDAWHAPGRSDGGYSLERIDLSQPCLLGDANWTSAENLSGGTPGAPNSAAEGLPSDSLRITRLDLVDASTLVVRLNRALASEIDFAFALEGAAVSVVTEGERLGAYELELTSPLSPGQPARIGLNEDAESCLAAESVSLEAIDIGIPDESEPGDWELNEIMYDPASGDGRWLELINVSSKLLSTSGLRLARLDDDGAVDDLLEPERDVLVPAGGFLVWANDAPQVIATFQDVRATAVVEADVPTLGDEECLQLYDPARELIFWTVCYSEDWHNRAYANTDGVSLERISLAASPNNGGNWTSASTVAGLGTPTRTNSQVLPEGAPMDATFALVSERISPDGDGFEDLLGVNYAFGVTGALVNFGIYDIAGRAVFELAEDISAGAAGSWTWDGVDSDGNVAPRGTYVLRASYFTPDQSQEVEYLPFSLLLAR